MGVSLFREHAPDEFGVFTLGLYSMFRLTAGETQVRTWLAPLVRSGSHTPSESPERNESSAPVPCPGLPAASNACQSATLLFTAAIAAARPWRWGAAV